jgi:hypothetical protein
MGKIMCFKHTQICLCTCIFAIINKQKTIPVGDPRKSNVDVACCWGAALLLVKGMSESSSILLY